MLKQYRQTVRGESVESVMKKKRKARQTDTVIATVTERVGGAVRFASTVVPCSELADDRLVDVLDDSLTD